MKLKSLFLILIVLMILGGGILLIYKNKPKEGLKITNMKFTSTAFIHNQLIPSKYTCDGQNVNPPLTISDVPTDAKSLSLIVDDPDAPLGTWVHWLVANIDPQIKEIGENNVPANAIQGITSFGKPGYGGPCPPSGTHHYFFKIYALDTTLDISPSSTKEDLEKTMTGHILDKTELIGLYSRK